MDGFSRFYEACTHPLIYNGDLNTLEDIYSVTDRYPSLKGVMLGRGLLSHPWLAAEYLTGQTLSEAEKRTKLATFHQLLAEQYTSRLEGGDHQILAKLKTLWEYLLPDAEKRLRKKVLKMQQPYCLYSAVKELLSL